MNSRQRKGGVCSIVLSFSCIALCFLSAGCAVLPFFTTRTAEKRKQRKRPFARRDDFPFSTMSEQVVLSKQKHSSSNMVAGGVAGFLADVVTHPLDTVKAKSQVQVHREHNSILFVRVFFIVCAPLNSLLASLRKRILSRHFLDIED
jgi:hypothetical protein